MRSHTTSKIFMVKPFRFFQNPETSVNNYFQKPLDVDGESISESDHLHEKASEEFDKYVSNLKNAGVDVVVWESRIKNAPDAIFPNNWLVTTPDKSINLMPMFAENRRIERDPEIVSYLKKEHGYESVRDFTSFERENRFFEGTGSVVFHHPTKTAYVSLSVRAEKEAAISIMESLGYKTVFFTSMQNSEGKRKAIYHTNVVLSVGEKLAVVCLDAIDDSKERESLINSFKANELEILDISEEQMEHFCGNILQVRSKDGDLVIGMSEKSKNAFKPNQIEILSKHGKIVTADLHTIETLGGGGARCMMAELF